MVYYCLLIILLFLIFFYRKPSVMIIRNNEDIVYSPAYGKIMDIIYNKDNTIRIPIFLSPVDIHYQLYPIGGILTNILYDNTGKYELAYKVNKSNQNEKAIHTIINKHGEFKIFQIAGTIVRRINYFNKPITKINTGELLGIIHFGSRVDIIIPNANNFNLNVTKGDRVSGMNTILGYY